jgi:hypothetical protein
VKVNLELQSKPDDYIGYSEAPAAEDPYQDPYSTSFSDPYQQSKPYQGILCVRLHFRVRAQCA